ncbi:MAG: cupredoxin domain-containing protein [Candidatus Moranbacteria bacterium]|nr:cupredoxin domain-containing protein [Candidatus Moranbacteria bacterium]
MVKGLLLALFFLVILEGIAWFVYTDSQKKDTQNTQEAMPVEPSKNTEMQVMKPEMPASAVEKTIDKSVPDVTQKTEKGNTGIVKEFAMIGRQFAWEPATIKVKQGDTVRLKITSEDVLHGIVIPGLGIDNTDIPVGETKTVEFVASKKGRFEFLCSTFCGDRHIDMTGVIIIE